MIAGIHLIVINLVLTLNGKTQVSFDEGLNKTIDWYLDHIDSWEKQ